MHWGLVCMLYIRSTWYSGSWQIDRYLFFQIVLSRNLTEFGFKNHFLLSWKNSWLKICSCVFKPTYMSCSNLKTFFFLARFQIHIYLSNELLNEAEMVTFCLFMYATAVVWSNYNNTCNLVLFWQKPVKQKKVNCKSR